MKNQTILFFSFVFIAVASTYGQLLKDTVVDIDGNKYHTVKLGTQTWLVENLKVTRYRNGDSIPYVKNAKNWSYLTSGAYCNYKNDTLEAKVYGRLYNWYAVKDTRSIAPEGWHIPDKDEWKILTKFLGGNGKAGGKLKETTYLHWISPNKGATNSSGFLALPGGYRYYNGVFGFIGESGGWWLTSEYNATEAWSICLSNINAYVLEACGVKANGFSVRCIKDNE